MSLNEPSSRANRRTPLLTFAALIHFLVNDNHSGRLCVIVGWHLFVIVVYWHNCNSQQCKCHDATRFCTKSVFLKVYWAESLLKLLQLDGLYLFSTFLHLHCSPKLFYFDLIWFAFTKGEGLLQIFSNSIMEHRHIVLLRCCQSGLNISRRSDNQLVGLQVSSHVLVNAYGGKDS